MTEEEEYATEVIKYTCQKICKLMFSQKHDQVFAIQMEDSYSIVVNCDTYFVVDEQLNLTYFKGKSPGNFDVELKDLSMIEDNLDATGNRRIFVTAMKELLNRLNHPELRTHIRTKTKKEQKLETLQGKVDLAISKRKQQLEKRQSMLNKLFKKK